ncbi:MRP8 (YKL142W) [Zygosaccharomyces parabailii]|uniref:BN860_09538g1_1 n=1 Tax=Zygosaccharomyces bailii (strain CLIB 213 / ATCC 58445 / CBS 680 / BCRC 21525 / NBRC 1098 / NCYC 1416 / NRRL Y-2227) TaxID=1333698 RepID=A0A8J2T3D6_ZYGB2|nr:MRP8 (YKL142W) [Zygosaccharomyces parabailii]CDF88407.1 BN860_09538g1_1 [Zygosaccharomyces bailii CLIB 213]CDH14710.1 related to MRP8-Ribosomal protein,mitochondrial [Zygosaccharomyces bailii ISA1307]SJM82051.1 related to Mrp8p [Zygosaccharomyces bailii]
MPAELDHIKQQVADLQRLVKKQSLIISKTGQNVLEMQISKQRSDVGSIGPKAPESKHNVAQMEASEVATNEDLVQLVGELQGQLDTIEERNVRRLVNATKTQPDDILAPLPNADSEIPESGEKGVFAVTLREFEELSDVALFKLAKFYELLPPSLKEQEKFEDFMEGKVEDFHISEMPDEEVQRELKNYSSGQLDDIFNDLARYLGLRSRRGTATW